MKPAFRCNGTGDHEFTSSQVDMALDPELVKMQHFYNISSCERQNVGSLCKRRFA